MDELRVNNEVKTEGDSIQYIVIKLGAEQYGIDIKYVDNIVSNAAYHQSSKGCRLFKGRDQSSWRGHPGYESASENGTS